MRVRVRTHGDCRIEDTDVTKTLKEFFFSPPNETQFYGLILCQKDKISAVKVQVLRITSDLTRS